MHFDFIAEGWKPDLDAMENYLNTRSFPMEITHADGRKEMTLAPGALRPRRFYTYVFPREHLQAVINSLQPARAISRVDGIGTNILGMPATALRKMLRLKRFPDIQPDGDKFVLVKNNIRVLGLGYRDDIDMINEAGIKHEAL